VVATELILLPRVAFRGNEIAGPRLQGLLALLATELRADAGTGRPVDGCGPTSSRRTRRRRCKS
jgi:hypothetical protein